jgi:serine/threonine protein kinase
VGSGQHGTVYKVLDTNNVPVAMKVVKKARLGNISLSLTREIESLRGLHHPNIVELYEVIND